MTTDPTTVSLIKKFFELNPVEAAHSLESLDEEEASAILVNISPEVAANAFDFLGPHFASKLLQKLPSDVATKILSEMTSSRAAELILCVKEEHREELLEKLNPEKGDQIRKLITYPENTAGRIMTPEFIAFNHSLTVGDAVKKIRVIAQQESPFNYVYVTNDEKKLVGVLNMRALLLAPESEQLSNVMNKEVFKVEADMDRERIVQELSHRNFSAVPVVDQNGHLLGTILTEEIIVSAQEEATEDIQKMFGAGGDEDISSPLFFAAKRRMLWLHINLWTAFLASSVIALFQGVIAKMTALAIFLPIVASQGGNTGAQSLAVVIRSLVLRKVDATLAKKTIIKEGLLGLLNGLSIGLVTGFVTWLWNGNPVLGIVIFIAMVINMVAAGVSGAAIPTFMKAIGRDPAQSSNIILTTVTDVVGFFVFLGLAVLFQPLLLK